MDFNIAPLCFPTQNIMPSFYPLLDLPLNPSPFYYNPDLLYTYLLANKENLVPQASYYPTADDIYHAEQPFKKVKIDTTQLGMMDNLAQSYAAYRRNSDLDTTCSINSPTLLSRNPYSSNFPLINQAPYYNANFQDWSSPLSLTPVNSSQSVDIPLLMPENQDCRDQIRENLEEKTSQKSETKNDTPAQKMLGNLEYIKNKYMDAQDEARKKNSKSHLQKRLEAMIMTKNPNLLDKVNKNNQRVISQEVSQLFSQKGSEKYVIQSIQKSQDIQALVNKKEKQKPEEIEETASVKKLNKEPYNKAKKEQKKL